MTYPFQPTRMAKIKKKKKKIVTSVGKDVDKLEPSYTAGSTVS